MISDLEADTAAFIGQRIDGRLNIFTGPHHHRATARCQLRERRKDRPAVMDLTVRFNDGEVRVVMMNAERWCLIQALDVGIRRPGHKAPVVAAVDRAACDDRQGSLHAMFQHKTWIRCGQFDQPVGGEVQVDQLRPVRFPYDAGLVPPNHAQMFGGIDDTLREVGRRQRRTEGQCLVGIIHRHLAHLAGKTGELTLVARQFHPISRLDPQDIVAPEALHPHGRASGENLQ